MVERTRTPLASRATVARSLGSRLKGLLGRKQLPEGEALVLPGCSSIHMWGMQFPIDAIFVDRDWRVVELKPSLAPWRVVLPVWKAWAVIEVAAGSIERAGVTVGDQLQVIELEEQGDTSSREEPDRDATGR